MKGLIIKSPADEDVERGNLLAAAYIYAINMCSSERYCNYMDVFISNIFISPEKETGSAIFTFCNTHLFTHRQKPIVGRTSFNSPLVHHILTNKKMFEF